MSYKMAREISEKQNKIYCGSGKKKAENWISASINLDKIKDHIQEYNGSKFIRININIKPFADQYGKDVSISIDTWKPENKNNFPNDNTPPNDLPF